MYRGKYCSERKTYLAGSKKSSRKQRKLTMPALIAILLVVFTVGGTMAYLVTHTEPVENRFTPASLSCTVHEEFANNNKSSITVNNTGDIPAYIRIKLVSYRVSGDDDHRIGGSATIPTITLTSGWKEFGGYYYYTMPVAPGAQTPNLLGAPISLIEYADADGGRQVIEVMAEAIQSEPDKAVGQAWGVTIGEGSVAAYSADN